MAEQRPSGRRRSTKSNYTTRSGSTIKVNHSLSDRLRARRDDRARRKAARLAALPKGRFKRIIYRLEPKRMAAYWFSRDGAIMALKVVGIGIVAVFILLIGLFAYFRKDLPKINDISGDNLGGSITYYDRTGQTVLWQDYNAVKRVPVQSNNIATVMKEATVATEDKNFYKEGAFSISGITRAGIHDLFGGGGSLQGGSTITQQLVKLNENWTANRTIARKVKELILAVDLEREYSKDQILTGYLNIAPYGGVDYGVQVAAQDYFHEDANQITLPQAAFLAAIPQSPDYYSPYSPDFSKQALIGRMQYVYGEMVKIHYITQAQADQAEKVDVLSQVQPQQTKYSGIQDPYFVLAAKNELEQKYGASTVNRGGWKVTTTVNLQLQHDAEQDVANNLPNVERDKGDEEALVMEDVKTGQIVAEVGGTDFNNPDHGQINYAQTNIPPGSSFKPYDYVSLINDTTDAGAGAVLYDVQQPLPGYPCTNKARPFINNVPTGGNCLWDYDFRYPGPLSIRYALAGSRNVPAVKAMLTVGTNKVISTADSMMGYPNAYQCYSDEALTKPTQCYGASAIGDGAFLHLDQHVNGDATLARLGQEIPNTYILKITDASGKTIYDWTQPKPTQVVRTDAAYIVDNMLSDPRATYLPGSCSATDCTTLRQGGYKFQRYKGWDIAVKTGTTNDNFDGLMTAWSTQFAVASWVGYHTRNVALTAGQMEYMTEPLTRTLMEQGLDSLNAKPVNWTQPSDIKTLPGYVQRTHVGLGSEEPGPTTEIFPSWYVPNKSSSGTQTLDKVSGDLATSCTPDLAKETVSGANDNAFSADIFWPINKSSNTSTTATDPVHNCSDSPPSVTLTVVDNGSAQQTQNSCTGSCTVTATVTQGTHPLSDPQYPQYPGTVNISVNGQVVKTFTVTSSPSTVSFTYTPTANGTLNISAQVIDSVLYSGTDSATVTATTSPSPAAPNSGTATGPGSGGGNGNGH